MLKIKLHIKTQPSNSISEMFCQKINNYNIFLAHIYYVYDTIYTNHDLRNYHFKGKNHLLQPRIESDRSGVRVDAIGPVKTLAYKGSDSV